VRKYIKIIPALLLLTFSNFTILLLAQHNDNAVFNTRVISALRIEGGSNSPIDAYFEVGHNYNLAIMFPNEGDRTQSFTIYGEPNYKISLLLDGAEIIGSLREKTQDYITLKMQLKYRNGGVVFGPAPPEGGYKLNSAGQSLFNIIYYEVDVGSSASLGVHTFTQTVSVAYIY